MLNITFTGNVFNSLLTQYSGDEVAYQALFYSPSLDIYKWSDKRLTELGKYNINLGDSDWLDQTGSNPYNGDKFIICFWTDNTKNRTDLDLNEWSFIEIEHDNKSIYLNDIQTDTPKNPLCLFDISGNVTINNESTNDNSWLFHNTTQYQEYKKYDEIIFPIMEFQNNCIEVDWGDSIIETFDFIENMTHIYDEPGDYHIIITLENTSGVSCSSEFDVQAYAIIDDGLTWNIPSYRNLPITFTPVISGDISQILSVTYNINGVETYTNLQYDESFQHTFANPGPHTVTQDIIVDNVYEISHIITDFTVYLDSISNFFKDDEGTCGPVFVDSSIVGNGNITEYYWAVKFDNEIISEYTGDSSWEYLWPHTGLFTVIHKIKDSEENQFGIERIYDVQVCPGSAGDNGGWAQTVYVQKDPPKLKVTKVKEIDEIKIFKNTQNVDESAKEKVMYVEKEVPRVDVKKIDEIDQFDIDINIKVTPLFKRG